MEIKKKVPATKAGYFLSIIFSLVLVAQNTAFAQWSDWVAPEEAKAKESIYEPGDADAIDKGIALYATICFLCHGDQGKGDGLQAPALSKKPADLNSEKVQQQTDGELFWKITNGNEVMLPFAYFTEEERWQLISYIRAMPKLFKEEEIEDTEDTGESIEPVSTEEKTTQNNVTFIQSFFKQNPALNLVSFVTFITLILVFVALYYTISLANTLK